VDTQRILPEHPHWALVFMLVLTQLSVGAMAVLWLLDLFGHSGRLWISAAASLALAGVSLGASTLHLGRPIYAWRAMRGLRRSWLSREVLSLSLFAGAASLFAGMLWTDAPGRSAVGLAMMVFGLTGVTCSARIYVVPARPAWNSGYTIAEFVATAVLLGPLFVRAMGSGAPGIAWAAAAGGAVQLISQSVKFLWLSRSEEFELRASSLLLSGRLQRAFLLRMGLLVLAGIVSPIAFGPGIAAIGAFALALAGEFLGRWLFFVSVVPKNVAAAFSVTPRAAA
jgi:DMSO reductase anchor subunit